MKKVFETGCNYEGQKNAQGLWHGKGKVTYMDGTSYEGEWVEGLKQGQGIYMMRNGDIYTGHFERDYMHGAGELMQSNG